MSTPAYDTVRLARANDGPVVGKAPVAVQLKEVRAEIVDII